MPNHRSGRGIFHRLDAAVQSVLSGISFYLVPLAIGLFSTVSFICWKNHDPGNAGKPVDIRVFQPAQEVGLDQAAEALARAMPMRQYETRLSERPVWFAFPAVGKPWAVEFPSRHAVEMMCWDPISHEMLGAASRHRAGGALAPLKAGFMLALDRELPQAVCRVSFVGPARLTVLRWQLDDLQLSERDYHRKSGLLDGGFIVLAVFVLIIALLNREKVYLLFAGWLLLNLRVAALSEGWDMQWLGQELPPGWLLPMRSITIALYVLATLTLYVTLFRENLARSRFRHAIKLVHYLGLVLLVAAIALPFHAFLPVMWVICSTSVALTTASLASIMVRTRSRIAFWYALSFGVTFASGLAEVAAAALGAREFVGIANSVTAALASSLLAAVAVSEHMRMEHAQRLEAQAQLQHTYEVMPIGLFTMDVNGALLSANQALLHILGADPTKSKRNWLSEHFERGAWITLHDLVHHHGEAELELTDRGGERSFLVKATLSRGKIEGFLQDMTEKSKATQDLLFMANNDPLTKVHNRRGIEQVFDAAVRLMAEGKPVSLAYLDLDRFKLINDLFGHAAGDEVLKQVCERIKTILATTHEIGRIGGDEFIIVMPDTAVPLASLICRGVVTSLMQSPYRVGNKAFHVRGSMGLVEVTTGMTMQEAVSAADRACREAKSGYGDGMVVYDRTAAALKERQAELELVEQLSSQDATRHLFLEMQPIMSMKQPADSLNFEVLLRMHGRDGAVIPAGRIIAAAEQSGLTGMIDRWVLSSTLAWIEANLPSLPRTQFVCMNLNGASLNDEHFIQDTLSLLADFPRGARLLCIEITESVALHDLDNTRRFINEVRGCGVKVALDDFGAGYTSFSYLKELPADVLKIDGNFIVNINMHPANVAIVEAIVNLAMNLGMKTIAEWAEDAATVRTLAAIGVDYVQGYAIARSQRPENILLAHSAASFIRDEDLLLLLDTLDAGNVVESANIVRLKGLH
jgi:diguanylate cyclase (GGDEF)-like protein